MARGNDPQDRYALQATAGFACVAFFDIILIVIGLLLLAFITGFAAGTDTTLTLLHGVHIVLIIVALIIFILPELYLGVMLMLLALGTMFLDIAIIIIRGRNLILAPSFALVALFILDAAFLVTSVLYLMWFVRAYSYYGLVGDDGRTSGNTEPLLPEKPQPKPIFSPVTAPLHFRGKGRIEF